MQNAPVRSGLLGGAHRLLYILPARERAAVEEDEWNSVVDGEALSRLKHLRHAEIVLFTRILDGSRRKQLRSNIVLAKYNTAKTLRERRSQSALSCTGKPGHDDKASLLENAIHRVGDPTNLEHTIV